MDLVCLDCRYLGEGFDGNLGRFYRFWVNESMCNKFRLMIVLAGKVAQYLLKIHIDTICIFKINSLDSLP